MIHFYHVTKRFDAYSTALHDVTFHIEKGEFVFLTGPSGAGKSTLLKLILRQIRPTEGQIVVNGRNLNAMTRRHLPYFRREIGMVFQEFKLIERMTIFENLSFILTVIGLNSKEHKKKAYTALRAVGLQHKMNYYPLQLSGGEQQRVAIARALAQRPELLLCDEPTGHLDSDTGARVLDMIEALRGELGFALVIATHDADVAVRARRTVELADGRIVAEVAE